LTLRQRDGRKTLTEVLYHASVYRDADGKVLGVFAAARDVTEQMKADPVGREGFLANKKNAYPPKMVEWPGN
jgi:hypothetical protein